MLPLLLRFSPRIVKYFQFLLLPVAVVVGYMGVALEDSMHKEKNKRDNEHQPTAIERRQQRELQELMQEYSKPASKPETK
eukprot:m.18691 g.18691  ORF g.18691 m.18691 type:complete len:80 (-) comp10196_c0_seq1:32-271(-)